MPVKFQQRHFEALAALMQRNVPKHGDKTLTHEAYWQQIIGALAAEFKADNPHFDENRFRAACVPGANVRARHNNSGPAMPYVATRNS